jgi:hypothetical protein
MFRIHVQRSDESTALTIEGRLIGPWVKELEKCWRDQTAAEPAGRIVVVLAAVSFVDAEGKDLLRRMRRQGAVLTPRGCLMQAVVNEIEASESAESLTRSPERTR